LLLDPVYEQVPRDRALVQALGQLRDARLVPLCRQGAR